MWTLDSSSVHNRHSNLLQAATLILKRMPKHILYPKFLEREEGSQRSFRRIFPLASINLHVVLWSHPLASRASVAVPTPFRCSLVLVILSHWNMDSVQGSIRLKLVLCVSMAVAGAFDGCFAFESTHRVLISYCLWATYLFVVMIQLSSYMARQRNIINGHLVQNTFFH